MAKKTPVTYAALHTQVFVPGAGPLGPTLEMLSPNSSVKSMSFDGDFLYVVSKKDTKVEVVIPTTNISHLVLKEEKE